jgi:glucosamine-phosphate N-acetyltransferase
MLNYKKINLKNIKIRNIAKRDLPEVFNLLQGISIYKPLKFEYKKNYKNFGKQKNAYGLVAEIETNNKKKIIGFCSIFFYLRIRGGVVGHIEDVIINSKFRKRNIGKAMILRLISFAKIKNCYKINLVCQKKTSIFYKKMNFLKNGISMNFFFNK